MAGQYEDKPFTGVLFVNDYKKADNHPDMRGPFVGPNGEEWEIAAWKRTSKNGKELISVTAGPKFKKDGDQTQRSGNSQQAQQGWGNSEPQQDDTAPW